jgi:pseudouridine-5'-phosphate glycosidase
MPIQPSAEVTEALRSGRPLVALESTLICHGIPRPRNLALAQAVEAAVREAGAVPATVALIGGKIRVGLEPAWRNAHRATSPQCWQAADWEPPLWPAPSMSRPGWASG